MADFWIWILLAPGEYAGSRVGVIVAGTVAGVVLLYLLTEWIGVGRPVRLISLALLRLCVALVLAWFAVVCASTALLGFFDGPYAEWMSLGGTGLFSSLVVAIGSALWAVVALKVLWTALNILRGGWRRQVV